MPKEISELGVRLARCAAGLSPPVEYFTGRSGAVLLFWIIHVVSVLFFFVMLSCASVYLCNVVTCWKRADLLALICYV